MDNVPKLDMRTLESGQFDLGIEDSSMSKTHRILNLYEDGTPTNISQTN